MIIMFLQTFSVFVIQADYWLNKSYISKTLCINRDRPKMNCDGKCFLAKKIQAQEKKEQQSQNNSREKFEIQLFFTSDLYSASNSLLFIKPAYSILQENAVISFPRSIFHPPSA
jgi:hypothetical protein